MTDNGCDAGPNARFLAAGPQSRGTAGGRLGNALSVSVLTHAIACLCILLVAGRLSPPHGTVANLLQDVPRLAWIAPGGPGGSGRETPTPARQLQRPGQDAVAIPSKVPSDAALIDRTTPPDAIEVPVVPTTAGVQELPGVMTAITTTSLAQSDGAGTGGHAGSGQGPSDGPGNGFGPGGFGDGLRPGNGVAAPRLI